MANTYTEYCNHAGDVIGWHEDLGNGAKRNILMAGDNRLTIEIKRRIADGDETLTILPPIPPVRDYVFNRVDGPDKYPKIGDQFDVIWKQIKQMKEDGVTMTSEADVMLDQIALTKSNNPKP